MSVYGTALAQGAGKAGVSNAVNLPFNMAESAFNYYLNEKAAKNADKRQRQQFHDLYSIQAQLKQIKDAGLSPSLMYGGVPSQGGASAPQGGTRGGGSYTTPLDTAIMTDIENTKADTELKNAEAANLKKDTEKKQQEITNLVTENGYRTVATRLVVAQADLAECDADLAWETFMAKLQSAYSEAEHAANIARSSGVQADLDESTFEAAYQQAWAELDKTLSDSALNRAEVKLTKAQIKDLGSQIWKREWDVYNENRNQNRQDIRLSYDKQYMEQEISKWLREQNQWVEEMKLKGYEIKVDFLSEILGYVFNLGGVALTNAAKPKTTTTTQERYGSKGEYLGETVTRKK